MKNDLLAFKEILLEHRDVFTTISDPNCDRAAAMKWAAQGVKEIDAQLEILQQRIEAL